MRKILRLSRPVYVNFVHSNSPGEEYKEISDLSYGAVRAFTLLHQKIGVSDIDRKSGFKRLRRSKMFVVEELSPSCGLPTKYRKYRIMRITAINFLTAFFVLVSGFAVVSRAQVCTPAPVGLVSWYAADGNGLDSRSRNNGTPQNGATFGAGQVGQAFSLDGSDDRVTVGNPSNLNFGTGDFSVQAWVRTSFLGGTFSDFILSKMSVGNDVQFYLTYNAGSTGFPIFTMGDGSTTSSAFGTTNLADGNFHHLAGVREGTTLRLYVDGVQVGTATTPSLFNASSSNNVVIGGRDNTDFDPFFNGTIDEVQLFNRALSSAEIQGIFNAGTAGQCKPTATVAPSGQVGWFAGDGNANDIAGISNGALNGGAGFAVGRVGQTFNFDGVDDYVEVPDSPNLRITGTVTLEFWAKRNRFGLDLVLEKGGDWTLGQTNYGVGLHNINNNMFYIFYAGGGKGVDGVSDLNWHHYAVVATNGQTNADFYIDGVLRPVQHNFGSATINLNPSTLPLHIGAQVDGTFNTFGQNNVDELSIYDRGLSSTEIASVFNAGIAGKLKQNATIDTNSIVSLWQGENNALDARGANNGTLNGNGFGAGKVGQAFDINNETGITVADNPTLNQQNFTIEGWVTAQFFGCPVSCAQFVAAKSGSTGNFGFELGTTPNNGFLRFTFNGAAGGADLIDDVSLNDGNFHHVAATYDGTTMRIFLDGALSAQKAVSTTINYEANSPFVIGSRQFIGSTFPYDGLIDEVGFYSRPLTAAEIRANYEAGNALSTVAGDARVTMPSFTTRGTTQQIPLLASVLPPLPMGSHTGLIYDIATTAVFTGSPIVCFNVPSFSAPQFANLRVMHFTGGAWQNVTAASNTFPTLCTEPISSFSPFAVAIFAPSAANVSVGGRVLTPDGRPIPQATVVFTNSGGTSVSAMSNPFGFYRIDGLAAGTTYTVTTVNKRFQFETILVTPFDELSDFDITASSGGKLRDSP